MATAIRTGGDSMAELLSLTVHFLRMAPPCNMVKLQPPTLRAHQELVITLTPNVVESGANDSDYTVDSDEEQVCFLVWVGINKITY